MNGYQCDNCKTFAASGAVAVPEHWLMIFVPRPRDSASYGMPGNSMAGIAAFCGWVCLRDYSIAKTLVDEPTPTGDE